MLKKSLFSPARPRRLLHPPALRLPRQPLCPGPRLFPCFVLDTREAYLVKRRSFPDSNVSRFIFHERRGRPF
jgi:hypothetical protein